MSRSARCPTRRPCCARCGAFSSRVVGWWSVRSSWIPTWSLSEPSRRERKRRDWGSSAGSADLWVTTPASLCEARSERRGALAGGRFSLLDGRRWLIACPVQLGLAVGGGQEGEEDKGLEPDDVGVEPVVDDKLEGDDEGRGEGREPPDSPLFRDHGDEEGKEDRRRQEGLPEKAELGDLGEDGPWGLAGALEGQGFFEEGRGAPYGAAAEGAHREGEQHNDHPSEGEVHDGGEAFAAAVEHPEGGENEGEELYREPRRDARPAREGRGRRRQPYRHYRRHDYIVSVVVGGVQRVREDRPREEQRRPAPRTRVPPPRDEQRQRPSHEREGRQRVSCRHRVPLA